MKYSPTEVTRLAHESQVRSERRRVRKLEQELRFIEHLKYPAFGIAAAMVIAAFLIMLRYGFGVVVL